MSKINSINPFIGFKKPINSVIENLKKRGVAVERKSASEKIPGDPYNKTKKFDVIDFIIPKGLPNTGRYATMYFTRGKSSRLFKYFVKYTPDSDFSVYKKIILKDADKTTIKTEDKNLTNKTIIMSGKGTDSFTIQTHTETQKIIGTHPFLGHLYQTINDDFVKRFNIKNR